MNINRRQLIAGAASIAATAYAPALPAAASLAAISSQVGEWCPAKYVKALDIQAGLEEGNWWIRAEYVGILNVWHPGWRRLLEKYGLPGEPED